MLAETAPSRKFPNSFDTAARLMAYRALRSAYGEVMVPLWAVSGGTGDNMKVEE
jgi:hypothetical protein